MSTPSETRITVATSRRDLAEVRRLFGAYRRAVIAFADEAQICA